MLPAEVPAGPRADRVARWLVARNHRHLAELRGPARTVNLPMTGASRLLAAHPRRAGRFSTVEALLFLLRHSA